MDDLATELADGTLRLERVLDAPVEAVWQWIVDPEKRARWFAEGAIDLREGGAAELIFDHDRLSDGDVPYPPAYAKWKGVRSPERVLRIAPPHLFSMTFGGEPGAAVTFELSRDGDRTRLVLTQTGLVDPATRTGVATGWHAHLAVLAKRVSGAGVPDFWALHAEIEAAYAARSTG